MMIRTVDVVLVASMIAAATLTYKMKHQAEEKLDEVRRLEAEIQQQEDTIDLLKADWSLLTQPNRLQTVVEAYEEDLQLKTTEPEQFATLEELPIPAPVEPTLSIADITPAGADAFTTGSVKP